MKKNCLGKIKESLELINQQRKKCDKLYGKWKGYDNLFNSWVDKKYMKQAIMQN